MIIKKPNEDGKALTSEASTLYFNFFFPEFGSHSSKTNNGKEKSISLKRNYQLQSIYTFFE